MDFYLEIIFKKSYIEEISPASHQKQTCSVSGHDKMLTLKPWCWTRIRGLTRSHSFNANRQNRDRSCCVRVCAAHTHVHTRAHTRAHTLSRENRLSASQALPCFRSRGVSTAAHHSPSAPTSPSTHPESCPAGPRPAPRSPPSPASAALPGLLGSTPAPPIQSLRYERRGLLRTLLPGHSSPQTHPG